MTLFTQEVGWMAADFGIKDKNDCAIRAIANVTTGKGYVMLRQEMMDMGRKLNRGTPWHILDKVYREQGAKTILLWGKAGLKMKHLVNYSAITEEGITLKRFVETHPTGRHIVIVRGHALALVNGRIIDTVNNRLGKRVMASYYFGE